MTTTNQPDIYYDPYDFEIDSDPYPIWKRMRDEAPLYHVVAPPTGFAKDGAATIYRRIPIPAGSHRIAAKLADDAAGTFAYAAQRTVDLPAGRVVVIDFDPARGGFVLR